MSVLLEGDVACGKTALAAKLCKESDLPFIRMISPDAFLGKGEARKIDILQKTFVDSYKSSQGIIFLDDIERLIDFTPVGMRFSNALLQTLLVLIRKVPPVAGRRLMIVATTSCASILEDLQLTQAFNVTLHVSQLQNPEEIKAVLMGGEGGLSEDEAGNIADAINVLEKPIGIKQLLMVLEMARAGTEGEIEPSHFMQCLHTCGF
jgi:vesicle-fusing ATPase